MKDGPSVRLTGWRRRMLTPAFPGVNWVFYIGGHQTLFYASITNLEPVKAVETATGLDLGKFLLECTTRVNGSLVGQGVAQMYDKIAKTTVGLAQAVHRTNKTSHTSSSHLACQLYYLCYSAAIAPQRAAQARSARDEYRLRAAQIRKRWPS